LYATETENKNLKPILKISSERKQDVFIKSINPVIPATNSQNSTKEYRRMIKSRFKKIKQDYAVRKFTEEFMHEHHLSFKEGSDSYNL